jgi:MFS family permease
LSISLTLVGIVLILVWRKRLTELPGRLPMSTSSNGDRVSTPATTAREEGIFTPRFFLMCGFTFTVFLSLFQLIPTAPFHVRDLGGGPLASGLFLGALTFASAWSAPFTGAFADRIGRRKTLIIASLGLAAFTASYAFIQNYRLLLALVLVHGIVWSSLLVASAAYLTGVLPAARRGEGIAYWGLASVLAATVAPSVGFWVYAHGWAWLCAVTTALNLTMGVIAWSMVDDRKADPQPHAHRGGIEWHVVALSAPLFLYSYSYGAVSSFSAVYADALGIRPKTIFLTTLALVTLGTRPFTGRFGDRIGYRRIFLPSLAVIAVGVAALALSSTRAGLMASAAIFALGFGTAYPAFAAWVMRDVGEARRGAGVRRDPRGIRHWHRRGVHHDGLADWQGRLHRRLRDGRRAGGVSASGVPAGRTALCPCATRRARARGRAAARRSALLTRVVRGVTCGAFWRSS